jgi:signal transduction histidine kinase/CheY-like chemotaxis protein
LLSVRTRKLAIGVSAVLGLATLVALRGVDLRLRREAILEDGDRRAENLARVLAGYVQQTFAGGDAALRLLVVHSRRVGGVSAPDSEWAPTLQAARVGLTGIGSISVVDSTGIIRHSSQPALVGQSRRNQFSFTQLASGIADGLVADVPFRTVVGEPGFVIPLGRKLTTATGAFDGIVVASYLPDSLREFFRAVDVGRTGSVTVFHAAGFVLLREPSIRAALGEQAAGSPLFAAAKRIGGTGRFRGRVDGDGPIQRTAFRSLDGQLIVAVSLSEPELLVHWNRDAAASLTVGTVLALVLGAFLLLLYRQMDVRQSAEEALIRSQRLEALGQLTGGVAHDFNNLLTVILGNVSLMKAMQAQGPLPPDDESLGEIERAARRASDLTRQLLAFARRQPLMPRVVDLAAAIQSAEPMLRRVVGEATMLRVVAPTEPVLANVDPVQIETTLLNLCLNARDAMPRGGRIAIEAGRTVLDEHYARTAGDVVAGPYSLITVSDTGVGIPAEHIPRLFEPFFTTKGPGIGTGLGLSMVYGFVKQSGGHVRVYSEVGRGTSVKLYFPETTGVPAVSTPLPDEDRRGHGEVVLLVEDEPLVLAMAARLLRRLGYVVLEAKDGPSAIALVKPDTRIDLLLTDVMLPGTLTGPRLAEELKRQRPGLPVLLASGYSPEIISLGTHAGASVPFLAKPYDRRKLARAVYEALRTPAADPLEASDSHRPRHPSFG